jgi:1,4-alpha-glucan branching enzyme
VVWDLAYQWQDREWMLGRAGANGLRSPWSIYELHLGSWRRVPEERNRCIASWNAPWLARPILSFLETNIFST